MSRPGTPLPVVLSGETIERVIRLDSSLIYLVTGALEYLTDREPLEQTGSLTVQSAKDELSSMLWIYMTEEIVKPFIIGEVRNFAFTPLPDGWLGCSGQEIGRSFYADLFTAIGTRFGAGNGTTTFNVPDLRGRSAIGAPTTSQIGNMGGESEHVLTLSEMPVHSHGLNDPGHTHLGARSGGGAGTSPNVASGTVAGAWSTASATTGITIQNAGSGEAHNNMPPYTMLNPAIYAGVW